MPGINIDDKYTKVEGRALMSGLQALVRLPMAQIRQDRARGLNTAGFISGYRGSPLGGYDQQLMAAGKYLKEHDILVRPGVNEDLAATAIWGTQQLQLSPGARKDGVFGIWYGKGPGVDRSGDVFKHANAAGSSRHGGVLCIAGDDHGAKSSTIPHQSDHDFISAIMPVLYPSSIHEFIDMGLLGIAMSRYSGCWVALKVIADTVETTAPVDLGHENRRFIIPADFEMPPDGLNFRWPDDRWQQDHRLQNLKGYAAIAFGRANHVDRVTIDSPNARFGIMASGKAYEDARQALHELEINEETAHHLGIRLYKVGMPWPLEPEGVRRFALGLEEMLILEERREMIENQVKQELFNWRADVRPRIIGKFDNEDHPVLSLSDELSVATAVRVIAERLLRFDIDPEWRRKIETKLAWFRERHEMKVHHHAPIERTPFFCSGCPHNTSTRVPEGSRALVGIGCHFMVQWMDRHSETFSQMGGEGVPWTGMAPFTDEPHVFVNLGDGTYFHSGTLAIRQAVASGANMTYKILYNDAVAMTGGQHVDGNLSAEQITHQLYWEGVRPIHLLSDRPDLYDITDVAPGVAIGHRDTLDDVMEALRKTGGCSAIVYEQTCAAEKRRRRKRGTLDDPARRVVINPLVCEGCGDCSVQSNCISVEPLETEFGRKRKINQSSCNKDYSCLKGFCPSFVTIEGGQLRKPKPADAPDFSVLPEPASFPEVMEPYNIVITGVGGTGVLTIGAILGMAAHIENKACIVLDMAGLAQKGGAVLSHVRLGRHEEDVTAPRIVTGGADLLIGADDVVAASRDAILLCRPERTHGIVNTHLAPVAEFVRDRDFDFRTRSVESMVAKALQPGADFLDFTGMAERVAGDAIATNIMMVGYAWQKGLLPLSRASIEEAIELNGVAVKANQLAFNWGRMLAHDPEKVEAIAPKREEPHRSLASMSLDEVIDHRADFLTGYQDARLAARYRERVAQVRERAKALGLDDTIPRAVAVSYAKLLAYKDEYEVGRLHGDPHFLQSLNDQFEGDFTVNYHLAPPFMPGHDESGRPRKRQFGSWIRGGFKALAGMKRLRGTVLDLFGLSEDRKLERKLIGDYESLMDRLMTELTPANASVVQALLALPQDIRGYGPVKQVAYQKAEARKADLLALLSRPDKDPRKARKDLLPVV